MLKKALQKLPIVDGLNSTGIDNFFIGKLDEGYGRKSFVIDPSIVLIVQGPKNVFLGNEKTIYYDNSLLICTAKMPIESQLPETTPDNPYLSVIVNLDPMSIGELLSDYDEFADWRALPQEDRFVTEVDFSEGMEATVLRILEILPDAADCKILGQSLIRELYYEILKSPSGHILRNCAIQHSKANSVAPAIRYLEKHFKSEITIDALAAHVGMSSSALHKKFRTATSLSPIQFLKKLRLHNAFNLLQLGENVSKAAFESGYSNAAQFSREFKREFEVSPRTVLSRRDSHEKHRKN